MEGVSATVENITTILQYTGGSIIVAAIIVAGICYAVGSEKAFNFAKRHSVGIVIGAILIVGATGIASIVKGLSGF